jgi:hypothetical protein
MKKFILSAIIILMVIQFIQIDIKEHSNTQVELEIQASTEVVAILKKSCYDCHSNSVAIPWYGYVAPTSWYVRNHINNGKKVLNFSEFNAYDEVMQKEKYEKIIEATVIRMPLPLYTYIHHHTKLTSEEKNILKVWFKKKMDD